MDQPTPPTAAELGISDEEYARILRGVADRGLGSTPPAPVPAPNPERPRWGGRWLVVAAVLGLVGWGLGEYERAASPAAYAFLETVGDQPVTYSSCQQIRVAVYPLGGPADAEALVREAVEVVSEASGLDLVVVGAFGGHAPNWNFEAGPVHPDDPISVSWQDGAAIAEMTDHTAGLGGSRIVDTPYGGRRWVAGTIALSRDYYALLEREGDREQALAVLLHEFGHVLGLDHVRSAGELMNEDNLGRTGFGPGDLEGLRLLGQGPCV